MAYHTGRLSRFSWRRVEALEVGAEGMLCQGVRFFSGAISSVHYVLVVGTRTTYRIPVVLGDACAGARNPTTPAHAAAAVLVEALDYSDSNRSSRGTPLVSNRNSFSGRGGSGGAQPPPRKRDRPRGVGGWYRNGHGMSVAGLACYALSIRNIHRRSRTGFMFLVFTIIVIVAGPMFSSSIVIARVFCKFHSGNFTQRMPHFLSDD